MMQWCHRCEFSHCCPRLNPHPSSSRRWEKMGGGGRGSKAINPFGLYGCLVSFISLPPKPVCFHGLRYLFLMYCVCARARVSCPYGRNQWREWGPRPTPPRRVHVCIRVSGARERASDTRPCRMKQVFLKNCAACKLDQGNRDVECTKLHTLADTIVFLSLTTAATPQ